MPDDINMTEQEIMYWTIQFEIAKDSGDYDND